MNISRAYALANGYTIDDHTNPPTAYKGERFNPTVWTTTYTEREAILINALFAVGARINGEFDHPALLAFGPLLPDTETDCLAIVVKSLEKAGVGQP
jgi:hypothetical protein